MTRSNFSFEESEQAPSSVMIEAVWPQIDGGRYPVKRVVGDTFEVSADIFREGHDKLAAVLLYKIRDDRTWREVEMAFVDNDRWTGSFTLHQNATYLYTIEAFPDNFGTWKDEVEKKFAAGLDVATEILEGRVIIEQTFGLSSATDKLVLTRGLAEAKEAETQEEALRILLAPELMRVAVRYRSRTGAVRYEPALALTVDRPAARFASWYSMFPRSAGTIPNQSGTFKDVEAQLPRIRAMGFNVLYFTPIHPIGTTNRKAKNNQLNAGPEEPGVPYAIGGDAGGHDAIDPALGTIDDFRHLVDRAATFGLEIALDIAINASPDHPWATEHPKWFFIRPDGTIKYSENPPKKYEDIYPVNFATEAWKPLWRELRRILLFWVEHGVTAFRVDNPHTKPTIFWEWVIAEVHRDHPHVVFLSEAFTRPKVMKALAKAGFTQSYTYFTWRNTKRELIEYGTELTQTDMNQYFRGNFFVNTHDILPTILQEGGRAAFQFRAVLAATMSSLWGIYSGYELCEATPVPGREEYLDSEKYEFKVWDWDRPGQISEYIAQINAIRRAHPALQEYSNLRFFEASDPDVMCYGKSTEDRRDTVVVIVNLDPFHAHTTRISLPVEKFGIDPEGQYRATELLSGEVFLWTGGEHELTLDPASSPAMIFAIQPRVQTAFVDQSV